MKHGFSTRACGSDGLHIFFKKLCLLQGSLPVVLTKLAYPCVLACATWCNKNCLGRFLSQASFQACHALKIVFCSRVEGKLLVLFRRLCLRKDLHLPRISTQSWACGNCYLPDFCACHLLLNQCRRARTKFAFGGGRIVSQEHCTRSQ